jgi:hypothetical protein
MLRGAYDGLRIQSGVLDNMQADGGSDQEAARVDSLVRLVGAGNRALDVGARSGQISLRIADGFDEVVALDLVEPRVDHPKVTPVTGDATDLQFLDDSFDTVLCAEMLEHVPTPLLERACAELARVSRRRLVVGVPHKQDIRCNRTTCATCRKPNPPWGHVNSFDEAALKRLFPDLEWTAVEYIGTGEPGTNPVSAFLMDLAGNPNGTYEQEEACVHCNSRLLPPRRLSLARRVVTKIAVELRRIQRPFLAPRANWIHVVMTKPRRSSAALG